ncbi:DUF6950 family protein [Segnochrobactrum spirostomi]|uniref:DUF6950 domain-containing protein n=1 Tax=Segnochrobactrum spirostomi TaxID=2608987 RepID=A0A6A7Y4I0_9HYPH|nr:hypothetical protein [Segnochrobactrum spirostomi]MQT13635.1 hypothetical protein [Segnochrobactrum spirostomi]
MTGFVHVGKILGECFLREFRTPFAWGVADCVTWAADCALALTGVDPIADIRGTYTTERGAQRILVKRGWGDVAGLAASIYDEIPVAMAHAGDWTAIRRDDGVIVLGVSFGAWIIARGPDGLGRLDLTAAMRAFRVGVPAAAASSASEAA